MNLFKIGTLTSFIFSLLFLVSCSEEKKVKSISKTKIIVKTNQVKANRILNAEVQGMVCKMGCGASIRKELINTNAVESCEIDFEEERNPNFVKVTFDKDKISAEKIVSIINTMNERQFKVGKFNEAELIEEKKSIQKKDLKEENKETSSVNNQNNKVGDSELKSTIAEDIETEKPNLLQLFSRIVAG